MERFFGPALAAIIILLSTLGLGHWNNFYDREMHFLHLCTYRSRVEAEVPGHHVLWTAGLQQESLTRSSSVIQTRLASLLICSSAELVE